MSTMKERFDSYINAVYESPRTLDGTEIRDQLESAFYAGAITAVNAVKKNMLEKPAGEAARAIMELSKELHLEAAKLNSPSKRANSFPA